LLPKLSLVRPATGCPGVFRSENSVPFTALENLSLRTDSMLLLVFSFRCSFPAGASHRVNGYYGIPCNAIQHIYLNRCFDEQSITLYCYESMCCILMSRSMHKQWVKLYFDTAHEIFEQVIYYPNVVVDNYLSAKEGECDSFAWLLQTWQVGFLL